jgi:hypothetical protein
MGWMGLMEERAGWFCEGGGFYRLGWEREGKRSEAGRRDG